MFLLRFDGVTSARGLQFGANTPANRVRLPLGFDTRAASRALKSSSSKITRVRFSSGALVVTPSQGNLPLDPAKGQMMKQVTLRNCLFDYTSGDRAIAEIRSVDEITIEDCCFISRDYTNGSVNIDRLSGSAKILNGTKSRRLVLRNNLAKDVVARIGLGDGTRNAKVVTIPLHTPGEEVVYNAVTGEEVSRRSRVAN